MIKEIEITFETAKLAKEKGFPLTQRCYNKNGEPKTISLIAKKILEVSTDFYYPRVPQSILQKWLRDIHNLHIDTQIGHDHDYIWYDYYVMKIEKGDEFQHLGSSDSIYSGFFTYEKCLEEGLYKSLSLIKEK